MEGLIIGVPINFTKTKQFKSFMKSLVAVNGSLLRFSDTVNLIHHIKSLQSVFDSLGCADELRPGASWGDVESEVIMKKSSKASKRVRKDAVLGNSQVEPSSEQLLDSSKERGLSLLKQLLNPAAGSSTVAGSASAATMCTSEQHLKSIRRGVSAGVPKDAENLAGEAPHRESVEQQESVVEGVETKVRKGSSSATAEGADAQHISPTSVRQGELSSQRKQTPVFKCEDESGRESLSSEESSAGMAPTAGAKQRSTGVGSTDMLQGKSQSSLAKAAGSRYCSLDSFRGECDNCGGPHHRHVCPRQCVRCERDIPSRCSCHRWMQRRRRELSGLESGEQSLADEVQGYEDSHSCSKKKAYVALMEFVQEHNYIMLSQKSKEFTLEVQGELRTLLLSMRREDKCVLYRRAQRYYKGFGLRQEQLEVMLGKFCGSHPEVLSGKEFGFSLGWNEGVQLKFFHLMRAGACLGSEAPRKQKLLLNFYGSFSEVREANAQLQQRKLKFESGDQGKQKVQMVVREKQGPPAVPWSVSVSVVKNDL